MLAKHRTKRLMHQVRRGMQSHHFVAMIGKTALKHSLRSSAGQILMLLELSFKLGAIDLLSALPGNFLRHLPRESIGLEKLEGILTGELRDLFNLLHSLS